MRTVLFTIALIGIALLFVGCMDYILSLSPEDIAAIKTGVQTATEEAVTITLEGQDGGISQDSAQKIANGTAAAVTTAVEVALKGVSVPVDLSGWESMLASFIVGLLSHFGWVRAKNSPTGTVFGKPKTPQS